MAARNRVGLISIETGADWHERRIVRREMDGSRTIDDCRDPSNTAAASVPLLRRVFPTMRSHLSIAAGFFQRKETDGPVAAAVEQAGISATGWLAISSSCHAPRANMDQAWRDAERCLPDDPFLLEYLRNCSKNLRGVLLGTTSPLETLFPGGSPDLARNLYENSSGARYANLIVAAAVKAVVDAASAKRRLQILELGGGTGATTAAILPD